MRKGDDQHPLHSTNLLAWPSVGVMLTAIMDGDYCTSWCFEVCLFTLLSAVANQLLLQARLKPGPELTKKRKKDAGPLCTACACGSAPG